MPTLTARPTTYNGIPMRSRLEARVAAMYDRRNEEWVYEPRAFANSRGQYLPDFQLLGCDGARYRCPVYVEVRPTVERAYLAMPQMAIIWDSEPDAFLVIHVPGELDFLASGTEGRKWLIGYGG